MARSPGRHRGQAPAHPGGQDRRGMAQDSARRPVGLACRRRHAMR